MAALAETQRPVWSMLGYGYAQSSLRRWDLVSLRVPNSTFNLSKGQLSNSAWQVGSESSVAQTSCLCKPVAGKMPAATTATRL